VVYLVNTKHTHTHTHRKKLGFDFLFFFVLFLSLYCTLHFDIDKVHTPKNAFYIKLDKVLKFTLKITLACSYVFRYTTIIS